MQQARGIQALKTHFRPFIFQFVNRREILCFLLYFGEAQHCNDEFFFISLTRLSHKQKWNVLLHATIAA